MAKLHWGATLAIGIVVGIIAYWAYGKYGKKG